MSECRNGLCFSGTNLGGTKKKKSAIIWSSRCLPLASLCVRVCFTLRLFVLYAAQNYHCCPEKKKRESNTPCGASSRFSLTARRSVSSKRLPASSDDNEKLEFAFAALAHSHHTWIFCLCPSLCSSVTDWYKNNVANADSEGQKLLRNTEFLPVEDLHRRQRSHCGTSWESNQRHTWQQLYRNCVSCLSPYRLVWY